MIWFLLKKNFFDGWENIINILVPNIMCLLVLGLVFVGYLFGFSFNPISILLVYSIVLFGIAFIIVFTGAFAKNALNIANGESATVGDYFANIKDAFKNYFKFAILVSFLIVSVVIGVPLYIGLNSTYGVTLGMVLLLFGIFMMLALQWFIPLKVMLGFDFKKTLKKCFVILFDNFAFSLFMALYSLVLGVLSIFLLTFLPGVNGILLGYINALRLRMYKYDWLDQHPEYKGIKERKNIPWEALIKEDEQILGKKSFKSLFMPWKGDHED